MHGDLPQERFRQSTSSQACRNFKRACIDCAVRSLCAESRRADNLQGGGKQLGLTTDRFLPVLPRRIPAKRSQQPRSRNRIRRVKCLATTNTSKCSGDLFPPGLLGMKLKHTANGPPGAVKQDPNYWSGRRTRAGGEYARNLFQ